MVLTILTFALEAPRFSVVRKKHSYTKDPCTRHFHTYAFLEYQKQLLKVPTVESVIRSLLQLKKGDLVFRLNAFNHIFHQNG